MVQNGKQHFCINEGDKKLKKQSLISIPQDMTERTALSRPEEQYPLLMVDGGASIGGGDFGRRTDAVVVSAPAAGWNATNTRKKSWYYRWPEFFSACWMSFILFGIGFLFVYVSSFLCPGIMLRQPNVLITNNNTRTGADVFYHHIVPRGSNVSFLVYSEYLSVMAMQFPHLNFHVFFLFDDAIQTSYRSPRHPMRQMYRLPYQTFGTKLFCTMDDENKKAVNEFMRKYGNINITFMTLNAYMSKTPLRYRWRLIPVQHLTFYVRVYSVYQNGGIGLDLLTFNNFYNSHQIMDRTIMTILNQHENGFKEEEYKEVFTILKKNTDELNSQFQLSMFLYNFLTQLMNETKNLYDRAFTQVSVDNSPEVLKPLIRTHRSKRHNLNNTTTNITDSRNDLKLNITDETETLLTNNNSTVVVAEGTAANISEFDHNINANKTNVLNETEKKEIVIFYDFSLLTGGDIGPSYNIKDIFSFGSDRNPNSDSLQPVLKSSPKFLTIQSEGLFIAASSSLHPFLGQIISTGCQRLHPKCAIQNIYMQQCSSMYRDDVYCNSINII